MLIERKLVEISNYLYFCPSIVQDNANMTEFGGHFDVFRPQIVVKLIDQAEFMTLSLSNGLYQGACQFLSSLHTNYIAN